MGHISEDLAFAVRDIGRAGLNKRLGDPDGDFGWLVLKTVSAPVEVEHDPDDVLTDAERIEPHSHARLRWACYPGEAWLLADDPKWLLEPDELPRFRPEMLAVRADADPVVLASVTLPIRCDTCAQLLDVGYRRADGRTAVVPIAAGATVVLVALCGECAGSLLTPTVRVAWTDLN